ncbi:MAG: glycosyltransferase family 2 protein [Lachnospiraceae bacterium]|jgi:dolichol-phosphate mannosyltransferase|nr:glycosyltransferase family 2 protein [Lachnospiraceae bacterium]
MAVTYKEHLVSVVVSVYDEEGALPAFYAEAKRVLGGIAHGAAGGSSGGDTAPQLQGGIATVAAHWSWELIFVNDGSRDASPGILDGFAAGDAHVKVVHFSRNFGHEAAMLAGIDYARGELIVCLDADLQHPPACITEILGKYLEGYQVITMVRMGNPDTSALKQWLSRAFYRLVNRLAGMSFEENASDFFAVGGKAAALLRGHYRDKVRFLRGYVQCLGFRKTAIPYTAARRVAGESKYSFRKLVRFGVNTIMCFSDLPLKLGIYAGAFAGALGVLMMVYTFVTWVMGATPSGYPTIIILMCFMFAILFLLVGIIGNYIAVLFEETKDRPIYIVDETRNL